MLAIALWLGLTALNGTGLTGSAAIAQKLPVSVDQKFGHVLITGDQNGFHVFDSAIGRIW